MAISFGKMQSLAADVQHSLRQELKVPVRVTSLDFSTTFETVHTTPTVQLDDLFSNRDLRVPTGVKIEIRFLREGGGILKVSAQADLQLTNYTLSAAFGRDDDVDVVAKMEALRRLRKLLLNVALEDAASIKKFYAARVSNIYKKLALLPENTKVELAPIKVRKIQ